MTLRSEIIRLLFENNSQVIKNVYSCGSIERAKKELITDPYDKLDDYTDLSAETELAEKILALITEVITSK